ncbi:MAG: hypothetical protein H2043_06390 [Rhizobiales bacterium]|nr:hypothetical protein [Hyphomicrobiales bacterium]
MLISKIQEGQIIAPGEGVDVFLRPSPLRQERHHLRLPAGLSLSEILRDCDASFGLRGNFERLHISIGGHVIPERNWGRLRVKPGVTVTIVRVPGKGALRSIVSAIVGIFALVVAPYLAGPIIGGLGLTGAAATAVTGLIAAGITYAASIAINALFPVAKQESVTDKTKTLYSIGGAQNQASQYGAIPESFGTHRISPPYAAGAYTEIAGDDQYLRMLFVVGYGPVECSDIKIGETAIDDFDEVQYEVIEDHTATSPTLYTRPVYEEAISVQLDFASSWVTRTTADNVEDISIDLSFPSGVYRFRAKDGKKINYTVTVQIQYRVAGSSDAWTSVPSVTVTDNSTQAVRRSRQWTVPAGQYEVRTRKSTSDYSGADTVSETVYWIALRGRRNAAVINFSKPLTLLSLRIKASNELNGTVNTLNLIARPKILAFNGADWLPAQTTRNPADHFRQVLQGNANARPVADSAIDLDSIEAWWEFCDDQGFTFDYVATEQASVYERLTQIAAAGRASVTFRDAKWGVVWDEADTTIVQHFTPRNSWSFSSIRAYADLPHGFRVSFINQENGWLNDERVVYDDGYTADNATKFEGLEFPGVTDPDLIWRHGRYHIAQLRLQRETYSLTTDWEHLVCTRGDRVRVNHDVVLWGIGAARVKSVITSPAEGVVLDDTMTMEAGKTYSIRFRLADGSSITRTVDGADGEFTELIFSDAGDLPDVGDLMQFGENGLESVVLRVKSITPQADLTAKLELVDDAPAILQADTGLIPSFSTGIASLVDYRIHPPVDIDYVESLQSSVPALSIIRLTWIAPVVRRVSSYLVQYATAQSGNWSQSFVTTTPSIELTDISVGTYDVRVRAIFDNDQLSSWAYSSFDAVIFAGKPQDLEDFRIAINGDQATLQWATITDPAVSHVQIRFSAATSDATWATSAVLRNNVLGNSVQVPTMRGTYLAKAVTYAFIASENEQLVVSSVDPLTAFNAVELVDDAPAFAGVKTNTYVSDGQLRLSVEGDFFDPTDFFDPLDFFLAGGGFVSPGYYDFAEPLDLGAVYTSRVTSAITAYGELASEDVFGREDWFDVADFFGDVPGNLWDVRLQIATTEEDPSSTSAWTAWADLVVGDVVARGFRFRAVLTSDQYDVTPVVTHLSVSVDMPDRVFAEDDLVVDTGGRTITFSPAFRRLQGLAIIAQGMATGDYYEVSGKSESGFSIIFKNAAGIAVERSLDYVAKGYGVLQ